MRRRTILPLPGGGGWVGASVNKLYSCLSRASVKPSENVEEPIPANGSIPRSMQTGGDFIE